MVSDHNQEMLRCAFAGRSVGRIQMLLDSVLFRNGREDGLCWTIKKPKRERDESIQVSEMLHSRGMLA